MQANNATKWFLAGITLVMISSCGGSGSGDSGDTANYTVNITAGANGSIDPINAIVEEGDTAVFTVTVDSGYQIDSVSGCNGSLSVNLYTTGSINSDCTVTASFMSIPPVKYTVIAIVNGNGSINPVSASVEVGDTAAFTVTADSGYQIESVSGCNGSVSANVYTTGAINSDCTVTASFISISPVEYMVTTIVNGSGSIDPVSALVEEGNTAEVTVTADSGYQIESVSGCNGSLSANLYTTGTIDSDCTVTANFISIPPVEYTVTAIVNANGSIDPVSALVVEGNTAAFTVTADSDYQIDSVSGCSGSLNGNIFTTGAVIADCAVSAIFTNTPPPTVSTNRLNDTGFTDCTNLTNYDLVCNDLGAGTDIFSKQDGEHGRDVTDNDNSDGHAGFSFTKLDSNAVPLADQAAIYALNPWACVKDEVTGMTWEIKTDSGDLHDKDWRYSWYDSSGMYSGSDAGVSAPDESVKSCLVNQRCDSEKFIQDVNTAALCGYSDWRLPKRGELLSLMDFRADYTPLIVGWKTAFIDKSYFPNTKLEFDYWTDSRAGFGGQKRVIAFEGDPSGSAFPSEKLGVRLVRGGN